MVRCLGKIEWEFLLSLIDLRLCEAFSILTSLHGFAHFLLWITACLAAPQPVAYLRIEVLKERRNRGGTYPLAQDSKVKTPSLLLVGLGGIRGPK